MRLHSIPRSSPTELENIVEPSVARQVTTAHSGGQLRGALRNVQQTLALRVFLDLHA